jgi:hypothetical protein
MPARPANVHAELDLQTHGAAVRAALGLLCPLGVFLLADRTDENLFA